MILRYLVLYLHLLEFFYYQTNLMNSKENLFHHNIHYHYQAILLLNSFNFIIIILTFILSYPNFSLFHFCARISDHYELNLYFD